MLKTLFSVAGLSLAFGLALPVGAAAQSPAPMAAATASAAQKAQLQADVKNALEGVHLTPVQKIKIKSMTDKYQTQTANADAATKKADGKALIKNIYGVLTPDQQTQFKASMKSSVAAQGMM
jgi:hypothetical protein